MREIIKPIVTLGSIVKPDEWQGSSYLIEGENYVDESFPGCEFRLPSCAVNDLDYAVNIKITGKKYHRYKGFRCQIEFVHDGDENVYTGGWIQPIEHE